jgi:hypothetical protein
MRPFNRSWNAIIALSATLLGAGAGLVAQTAPPASRPVEETASTGPQKILPGEIWPDNRGQHVQAHGGGILRLADNITRPGGKPDEFTYFWFGEERAATLPRTDRAVSCYSSKDLVHWTFRRDVFTLPASQAPVLERPKVYYNAKTKKFVMYVHYDSGNYGLAEVGVAVSDTVDGEFVAQKHFRPLGRESRDIGQFIDDDGTAYLIFEDRPVGWHIARLTEDYMDVEKDVHTFPDHMEGGALVHYNGLYYAIGSHLTGWNANPNLYATAKSLEGPWSAFKDICPPEKNTYGAQSTMLVKVVGTKSTTVIFMGDIWRPQTQYDSRYLWMPLEIGDGKLTLPEPREWTLDIKTGEAVIRKDAPAMTLPAPARGGRGRTGATASAPATAAGR